MTTPQRRWDRMWVALPYAVLLLCVLLAAVSGDVPAGSLLRVVLVAAAVVVWHGWWVVAHPWWPESRLLPMAVYFVGMLALTHYLGTLSFTFFPLFLACYPMAFVTLPGAWAYAGVIATAAVGMLEPSGVTWTVENVVLTLGTVALISVAGGAIRGLEQETARRRSAMAALAETHADLERALAHNLSLQDQLLAEARDAGVAAERTRLAGEIHDTLAAGFAGIISQLEAVEAQLGPDHPVSERVTAGAAVARESLQEARRSVRALRPGALAAAALPAALTEEVATFERTQQIPAHLRITGDVVPVPEPVEDVLLRAVREALANVARHARAGAVHVTLSFLGDTIALDLADDGTGTTPGPSGDGHGLMIMRERLDAVGGRLDVMSVPGTGTTVTMTVPLEAGPSDAGR